MSNVIYNYEKEVSKLVEELKNNFGYVSVLELVDRFVDVDNEYNHEPWNLLQILANINMVTTVNFSDNSKWIPCSKQLPKSENKYGYVKCNVTVIRSHYPTSSYDICDEPYDEYFVADAMYDVSQKIWHLGEHTQLNALIDIEDLPLNCDYVIAWQPLPEPYKGENENDES